MFDRILIVVNGSGVETSTVVGGAALAAQFGSSVHLVYVINPPSPFSPANEPYPTAYEQRLEAEAREVLAALHAHFAPDTPIDDVVLAGLPVNEILAETRKWNADLVIIGDERNHRALVRFLLGSTADAIERRAPCPVLIMRHKEDNGVAKSPADTAAAVAPAA
jgi:nucleotide-binding universal stress UspA family protein